MNIEQSIHFENEADELLVVNDLFQGNVTSTHEMRKIITITEVCDEERTATPNEENTKDRTMSIIVYSDENVGKTSRLAHLSSYVKVEITGQPIHDLFDRKVEDVDVENVEENALRTHVLSEMNAGQNALPIERVSNQTNLHGEEVPDGNVSPNLLANKREQRVYVENIVSFDYSEKQKNHSKLNSESDLINDTIIY